MDIKDGDKVRVHYRGLEGWQTVELLNGTNILWLKELDVNIRKVEILEHKPQIKFQVGDKVRIDGDDILFGYEGYVTSLEDAWASINDKYDINVKDLVLVAKVVREEVD